MLQIQRSCEEMVEMVSTEIIFLYSTDITLIFKFLITLSIITYTEFFFIFRVTETRSMGYKKRNAKIRWNVRLTSYNPRKNHCFSFMKKCNNKMVARLNIMITYITFVMIQMAIAYSNAVKVIAHVLSLVAFWHDEMWLSNIKYSCFPSLIVYENMKDVVQLCTHHYQLFFTTQHVK